MGDLQTGDTRSTEVISTEVTRINLVAHATIRAAVARLQEEYPDINANTAFDALRSVAQSYSVKLRHLCAAVVDDDAPVHRKSTPAPSLSFSLRGRGALPKRSEVLNDLLATAVDLTKASAGAVHLRNASHGGLCIEGATGINEEYRQHFSYVDDAGSIAGRAAIECEVVRVDDVAALAQYGFAEQAVLANGGICAEVAVPMCDEEGRNWGAVTVMFDSRHPRLERFAIEMLHGHADSCAQWLKWYDEAVMPSLVAAVHDTLAESEAATA